MIATGAIVVRPAAFLAVIAEPACARLEFQLWVTVCPPLKVQVTVQVWIV